jgi:hypothetical protein
MPVLRRLLLPAALVVALAPSALADRLVLLDGRVVEGTVTKDGETYHVVSRFGAADLAAKDVKEWVRAKSVESEWRERLSRLSPSDHGGRAAIAKWLKDAGRDEEATATALAVLDDDPENAVAHDVLGHVRHGGRWMTPDEAKASEGYEKHGDAWYTPAEWALLDAAAKERAANADRKNLSAGVAARVNEAVRLMIAPDKRLRAEGAKRLARIAEEEKSDALKDLIPKVAAYADAYDQVLAAETAEESASVLTECRIQFAKLKRPIQNFTTTLASSLGGGAVTIQLPELEVIKVNTTVRIPAAVAK